MICMAGLPREPVVLDLGANHGDFSRILRKRFGGTYRMYEPNPQLVAELSSCPGLSIEHCAVASSEGEVYLHVALNDEGSSLFPLPTVSEYDCVEVDSIIVPARSPDSILRSVGEPIIDLIKMDIEGSEVTALSQVDLAELARVRQITVEFHSAPQFGFDIEDDVAAVVARLCSANFECLDFSRDRTDVLFLNRAFSPASDRRLRQYRLWARGGYPCVLRVRELIEWLRRSVYVLRIQRGSKQ